MNTRERKTDKVLRLGIVQGGTIIEERLVSGKDSISVGQSPKNEVLIPSPQVPNRHRLIEVKGGRHFLRFEKGMKGKVFVDGQLMDLKTMAVSKLARRKDNGFAYGLSDQSRGKLVFGDATVLFQFVDPMPEVPRQKLPAAVKGAWFRGIEKSMAATFAACLLFLGGGGGFLHFQHENTWRYVDVARKASSNNLIQRLVEVRAEDSEVPEETVADKQGETGNGGEVIADGPEPAVEPKPAPDIVGDPELTSDIDPGNALDPLGSEPLQTAGRTDLMETGTSQEVVDPAAAVAALENQLMSDGSTGEAEAEVDNAEPAGSKRLLVEKDRTGNRGNSLLGVAESEFGVSTFNGLAGNAIANGLKPNWDDPEFGGFVASGPGQYAETKTGQTSGVGLASLTGKPVAGLGGLLPPVLTPSALVGLGLPGLDSPEDEAWKKGIAEEAKEKLDKVEIDTEVVTEVTKEIRIRPLDIISGPGKPSKSAYTKTIAKKKIAFQRCLQSAGLKNPNVGGKLILRITVEPSGRGTATVVKDDTREASLSRCIIRIIEGLPFGPAKKKTSFKLPFILEGN